MRLDRRIKKKLPQLRNKNPVKNAGLKKTHTHNRLIKIDGTHVFIANVVPQDSKILIL